MNPPSLKSSRLFPSLLAAAALLPATALAGPEATQAEPSDISVRAEPGKGITFSAGDRFSLQLRARIQYQIALSDPTSPAVEEGASDVLTTESQIRRFRLVLAGHAFTKELRYYIQLGMATRDMEADLLVPLRDAYVTWQPHRDIGVRFGQMKVPYGQQRIVSSSALQFVDRSIVTGEFNLDRDVGVYLMSEDFLGLGGRLMYQAGVFGGRGRNRSGGPEAALPFARVQVNPFGSFDHLSEADLSRRDQPRLALGLSGASNLASNRTRSTHGGVYTAGNFAFWHLGADLHFKWKGVSVLSEFFRRQADEPVLTAEPTPGRPVTDYSRSGRGYFVQAGYVLPFPLEVAARFGEIRPSRGTAPEARFPVQRELGGAVSYYFFEHSLKLQADYFRLFGDETQAERHQFRLQAQLFY
jgi:hypothetical protein